MPFYFMIYNNIVSLNYHLTILSSVSIHVAINIVDMRE